MNVLSFDWDDNKNRINIQKHGLSFEEASTVFYDDYAIVFDDPDHSIDENRFLIIGTTNHAGLCIVSHCYRDHENTIRIISARLAAKSEKQVYNEQFI